MYIYLFKTCNKLTSDDSSKLERDDVKRLHAEDENGDVEQHEPLFGEFDVVFFLDVRQRVDGFKVRASEGLDGWTVAVWVGAGASSVLELRGSDALDGVCDRIDEVRPLPINWNLRVREVQTAEEKADGDEGGRSGLRGLNGRA